MWRDPQVGRDLLIGCAAGVTVAALFELRWFVPAATGGILTASPAMRVPHIFLAPGSLVDGLLSVALDSIVASFLLFFLLFLLRMLLRYDWLTMVVWGTIGMAFNLQLAAPWLSGGVSIAGFTIIYYVLMRVGFLPYMIGRGVADILLLAPLTFDTSASYAETGYAALAVALAIAGYGVWVSLGGRRLVGLTTASEATSNRRKLV
jgi:hypothetical protein